MGLVSLLCSLVAAAPALKAPAPLVKPAPPAVPAGPVVRRYAFVGLDGTPEDLLRALAAGVAPTALSSACFEPSSRCKSMIFGRLPHTERAIRG